MAVRSRKPRQGGTKEVRLNEDGTLDEVCVSGCFVHLEQMDDDSWWLGISRGAGKETVILHVNLWTDGAGEQGGAPIHARVRDEDLGCAIKIRDGNEKPWYREATKEEAKAKGWEGVDV